MPCFPRLSFALTAAFTLLFSAVFTPRTTLQAAPPTGSGWTLVWNDEFNGTSLDLTKWRHWLLGPRRSAVNSPSSVAVADGVLTLSTHTTGGVHYTGMIATDKSYLFTYGYIEARINYDSAPGMWSAFWLQSPTMGSPLGDPQTAGTEIDICEHRSHDGNGNARDGNIGGVIHWDGYGASHRSHGYDSGNLGLGDGYHIYGMEWTPTRQRFYINGVLRWTINNSANTPVSQRSEFIILSNEVQDGGWSGAVPAGGYGTLATTTTRMQVDYVRVYQRTETVVNGDFEGRLAPFGSAGQGTWSATGGRTAPAAAKLAPATAVESSVNQTVFGLLPDTAYILTGWGNPGPTAPALRLGVRDYGGSDTAQLLSTPDTFASATLPFTTGPTHRSARIYAASTSPGSIGYADDFLLRRAASVNNGQLETGDALAWNSVYGGAAVASEGIHYGGSHAWKIPAGTSSAGVEQTVLGLAPSTAYRLSAWTVNGGAGLTFGVKNHGASQVTSTVPASTWTRATVNFTTGASATSATIFAFRGSGTQVAYADAFFLSQPLAAPWSSEEVYANPLTGTAGRRGAQFVLQSGGANVSGGSDRAHFVRQFASGDVTLTARILGVDTTAYHAKAGLMIRESAADTARSASIAWGPVSQLVDFQTRATVAATAAGTTTERDFPDPPWLRLTRRGNVFTAYHSPDGAAWTRLGAPRTVAMGASTFVGLFACSGDGARLAEAALDHVSVTRALPDVTILSPVEGASVYADGSALRLTAAVTDSGFPVVRWSAVSGPGPVSFMDSAVADTFAVFSAPGTYVLRCTATTATGTGSDDITVHVVAPSPTDPALALHLRLDEAAGSIASDSSPLANHATASGPLVWSPTAGRLAGAAGFNGTDSFLTVPDAPSLDGAAALTLSFWFRADTLGVNTGLVSKRVTFNSQNAYGCFLHLDGRLSVDFDSNNNRFTSNTIFNAGAWYHIALVFDGAQTADQRVRLYVNGALDKTATETSITLPNTTAPLYLGTLAPGSSVFAGLLDEVRLHRRALAATEVAALFVETSRFVPRLSLGSAPAATIGVPAALNAMVSDFSVPVAVTTWSRLSGPGFAAFADPAAPGTTVTFDQPGSHVLRLGAANAFGEVFRTLSVTAAAPLNPSRFADWQQLTWPGLADSAIMGPTADPDADGRPNLLEWALGTSPVSAESVPVLTVQSVESGSAPALLKLSYTRPAQREGVIYTGEFSPDLTPNSWTSAGVTHTRLTSGDSETWQITYPASGARAFLRLRVSLP